MTTSQTGRPSAGIIGRTLRLMLGMLFVWMTYTVMRSEDAAFNLRILIAFAGITVFYGIVHFVVSRYGARLNRWFGAVLAVAPAVLVFALGGSLGRVAAVAYIGVSLLLQAMRGDGGCEVLAIPAMILGRRTHLVCILFSPVDWVEKHLTGPGGLPG
ncbi:MAG: hypothetical protein OEO20_07895 [Gemmatimonadota bacterium]|nr:hypothetical protein [Gemmatimonadota bacterium]MDH3478211.1 hypothetical protein [Gemmatimonadota bacterium]MDH3570990.1 hypothetical protein [Gemmatimonadota bacterium]MDH5549008.1 hypothetical protein [Gemmatimonadota bacterium]